MVDRAGARRRRLLRVLFAQTERAMGALVGAWRRLSWSKLPNLLPDGRCPSTYRPHLFTDPGKDLPDGANRHAALDPPLAHCEHDRDRKRCEERQGHQRAPVGLVRAHL